METAAKGSVCVFGVESWSWYISCGNPEELERGTVKRSTSSMYLFIFYISEAPTAVLLVHAARLGGHRAVMGGQELQLLGGTAPMDVVVQSWSSYKCAASVRSWRQSFPQHLGAGCLLWASAGSAPNLAVAAAP